MENKKLNSAIGFLLLLSITCSVFFVANVTYYCAFSAPYARGDLDEFSFFYYPLIESDHEYYLQTIQKIKDGTPTLGFNNNAGISYLYFVIQKLFGYDNDNIVFVAFCVNSLSCLVAFFVFFKIVSFLRLPSRYSLLFFINLGLIYSSQLINKELLSLLLILLMVYSVMINKKKFMFLLIPLSMVVRLQLGLIGFLILWLDNRRRYIPSIILLYIIMSIGAALVSIYAPGFDPEYMQDTSLGTKLVQRTYLLNQEYLIGSLILNPVRIIQYFYDLSRSLFFIQDGLIDLYKLRDVPMIVLLVFFSKDIIFAFRKIGFYQHTVNRVLITSIIVFVLVLLMNPLIHARYLFPILPLMILLGLSVRQGRKRFQKLKQKVVPDRNIKVFQQT